MVKQILFLSSILLVSLNLTASETQKNCIDQALEDLDIYVDDVISDPRLMQDILAKDMLLADVPGIQRILKKKITKPQDLSPMLSQALQGILTKHPAIVEVLCAAHERGLLKKVDENISTRLIHHMYLLDAIVVAMKNDGKLMIEVHDAIIEKRKSYDIDEDKISTLLGVYEAGAGVFGAVKTVTMDGAFKMYGDIRARGSITEKEIHTRMEGLRLNIREAYSTDLFKGYYDNFFAGLALNVLPPETVRVVGDEVKLQYVYTQDWTSLYHTWNLAFIIGNLDNLHLLLPKLLIPSVINAESEDYLFMRSLALWLSINFTVFAKLEERDGIDMPGAREIAELWGSINKNYAVSFLQNTETVMAKVLLTAYRATDSVKSLLGWLPLDNLLEQ